MDLRRSDDDDLVSLLHVVVRLVDPLDADDRRAVARYSAAEPASGPPSGRARVDELLVAARDLDTVIFRTA